MPWPAPSSTANVANCGNVTVKARKTSSTHSAASSTSEVFMFRIPFPVREVLLFTLLVLSVSSSAAQPPSRAGFPPVPSCTDGLCIPEPFDGSVDLPHFQPAVNLTRLAATSDDPRELAEASEIVDRLVDSGQLVSVAPVSPDLEVTGRTHQTFRQSHAGYLVHRAGVTVQRDTRSADLVSVFGVLHLDAQALETGVPVQTEPRLSFDDARRAVPGSSRRGVVAARPSSAPVVRYTRLSGYSLVYAVDGSDGNRYFIDATDGSVRGAEPAILHQQGRPAIGIGRGILGYEKNLSTAEANGEYTARDLVRPGSVVTLDLRYNEDRADLLQADAPIVRWERDLATSPNNRWADAAVVDAHAYAGFTYDWLYEHGWRGIDGNDGLAFQMVNVYRDFENAYFWPPPAGPEGTGVLVYGQTSRSPFVDLDTVAHEYQHGVTYYGVSNRTGEDLHGGDTEITARTNLVIARTSRNETYQFRISCDQVGFFRVPSGSWWYRRPVYYPCARGRRFPPLVTYEAGAAHEALSDVIATAVEHSVHGGGPDDLRGDWLIGEDLGTPIRDLQNPSRLLFDTDGRPPQYPQRYPSVYSALVRFVPLVFRDDDGKWRWFESNVISQDGGRSLSVVPTVGYPGYHWNSTILSHAYYRAAAGGCHAVTQVCVSGSDANRYSRDDVAAVFLRAVTTHIWSDSTLREVAAAIRQAASDLDRGSGALIRGIDRALDGVGL